MSDLIVLLLGAFVWIFISVILFEMDDLGDESWIWFCALWPIALPLTLIFVVVSLVFWPAKWIGIKIREHREK